MKVLPPPPGCKATTYRDGQPYYLIGSRQIETKDGNLFECHIWTAPCASCGRLFEIESRKTLPHYVTRRCPKHHTPGRPVRFGREVRRK